MTAEIKNMTEEQITNLEAQIKEWRTEKERKPLAWKPEEGEGYFGLNSVGGTYQTIWSEDSVDRNLFVIGNVFRTQELAKAELKRRQVKRQIEELIDKYDSERGGAFVVGDNYKFGYNVNRERIYIDFCFEANDTHLPHFSSLEVARHILSNIGEENIKLLFTEYPIVRGE